MPYITYHACAVRRGGVIPPPWARAPRPYTTIGRRGKVYPQMSRLRKNMSSLLEILTGMRFRDMMLLNSVDVCGSTHFIASGAAFFMTIADAR